VIWIPVAAWVAAAVIALVVLGFCAYELRWKSKRLRADLQQLQELAGRTQTLRIDLAAVQERLAATGLR
jgi:hypothetical protein